MESHNHRKILLVEDDSLIAMALQWEFERAGFDVVGVAHSERTALAATQETEPDVAIIDYMLASGTGECAAVALREAGLKVIIATGVVHVAKARSSLRGLWCLEKPYEARHAVQVARDLLESNDPDRTASEQGYLVL
jgi:DNA-binding response OmpR family regulator